MAGFLCFLVNGASPWAADASESASYLVETALGQYSSRLVSEWSLPDGFDADEVSTMLAEGLSTRPKRVNDREKEPTKVVTCPQTMAITSTSTGTVTGVPATCVPPHRGGT